jgi:hypothetical protein
MIERAKKRSQFPRRPSTIRREELAASRRVLMMRMVRYPINLTLRPCLRLGSATVCAVYALAFVPSVYDLCHVIRIFRD